MKNDYVYVGKSVPRIDVAERITGRAKYAVDLKVDNMLYGKIKLQPARTIEIIILDFIITRSGAAAFEEANVSVPTF